MDNDDYIKKLEKEMRKVYIDIGNAENDLYVAKSAIADRDYYADLAYINANKYWFAHGCWPRRF